MARTRSLKLNRIANEAESNPERFCPFRSVDPNFLSYAIALQRRGIRTTRFRRPHRPRSSRAAVCVHRIPLPTFVTIASAPCMGRDGAGYGFDLGQTRRNIFLQMGIDRFSPAAPVGQIGWRSAVQRLPIFGWYRIAFAPKCIQAFNNEHRSMPRVL